MGGRGLTRGTGILDPPPPPKGLSALKIFVVFFTGKEISFSKERRIEKEEGPARPFVYL
jgi:hypothetical protein